MYLAYQQHVQTMTKEHGFVYDSGRGYIGTYCMAVKLDLLISAGTDAESPTTGAAE
jgi:hypothetical protein